jgi:hypothetical protein
MFFLKLVSSSHTPTHGAALKKKIQTVVVASSTEMESKIKKCYYGGIQIQK